MVRSVWRYAHLSLALCSSIFLILASVTGIILAIDAINERISPYRVDDFNSIRLVETLSAVHGAYAEINKLTVDHNQFVILQGMDIDDNDVHAYIDPHTGKVI